MTEKKTLLTWLNDAYAMEQSIVETLEGHAGDAEEYPEVQRMIREHIEQTKSQAERVRKKIEGLGGSISVMRTGAGQIMGEIQGLMPNLVRDKIVKNAIVEHAAEHFEHASYLTLVEAAEYFNEPEVARVCREIMKEEVDMGEKLKENLSKIVREFLSREEQPPGSIK
ncbi:MAG: DUF892 family protein [Patescibacteria group bacterium]